MVMPLSFIKEITMTSGNPCLQSRDGGPARVGWAPLAHRHTQCFFFSFCPSVIND